MEEVKVICKDCGREFVAYLDNQFFDENGNEYFVCDECICEREEYSKCEEQETMYDEHDMYMDHLNGVC